MCWHQSDIPVPTPVPQKNQKLMPVKIPSIPIVIPPSPIATSNSLAVPSYSTAMTSPRSLVSVMSIPVPAPSRSTSPAPQREPRVLLPSPRIEGAQLSVPHLLSTVPAPTPTPTPVPPIPEEVLSRIETPNYFVRIHR